jgi:hypothetical protein
MGTSESSPSGVHQHKTIMDFLLSSRSQLPLPTSSRVICSRDISPWARQPRSSVHHSSNRPVGRGYPRASLRLRLYFPHSGCIIYDSQVSHLLSLRSSSILSWPIKDESICDFSVAYSQRSPELSCHVPLFCAKPAIGQVTSLDRPRT